MTRPYAKTALYTWAEEGTRTHGIAVMAGRRVLVHWTPDEARATADRLHDLADRLDAEAQTRQETHA